MFPLSFWSGPRQASWDWEAVLQGRVYYGPEEEPAEKQPERKPEPKPEKRTETRPEKRVEPKMEQAEKKPKKVEETPVVPALGEEVDDEKPRPSAVFSLD